MSRFRPDNGTDATLLQRPVLCIEFHAFDFDHLKELCCFDKTQSSQGAWTVHDARSYIKTYLGVAVVQGCSGSRDHNTVLLLLVMGKIQIVLLLFAVFSLSCHASDEDGSGDSSGDGSGDDFDSIETSTLSSSVRFLLCIFTARRSYLSYYYYDYYTYYY